MKQARNTAKRTSKPSSKTKVLETAPKNEVKGMFLQWFKKHGGTAQLMSKRDVVENVIAKLDAKQNDALEEAMNELERDGIIEVQSDGVTLMLTQHGADFIKG